MMNTPNRNIVSDESGATAVEYGLLVAVLSLSIVAGARNVTNQVYKIWHNVDNATSAARNGH